MNPKWRPIMPADQTGTRLLVFMTSGEVAVAAYVDDAWRDRAGVLDPQPTHCMSVPSAPSEAA